MIAENLYILGFCLINARGGGGIRVSPSSILGNRHKKVGNPCRRVTKFMYSMIHSDDTVRLMTAFFLSTEASVLAENFRYMYIMFKILMFAWYKELSVLLKCITCPSSLSDIELSNIDTVRELLSVRDEVLICPLSHSAAGIFIDEICIS